MKLLRRFLFALSLLFVLRVYMGGYDELLTLEVRRLLAAQNVPCEVSGVTVRPVFRPAIERLECRFTPGQPVVLQALELRFLWLDLFRLRPGMAVEWAQFGGKLSVELHRSITDGRSDMAVNIDRVAVGQLPQNGPAAFGGLLTSVLLIHLDSSGIPAGDGTFHINDFSVAANKSKISLLPEVRAGDLFGKLTLNGSKLLVKPIDMSSPFGVVNGELDVQIESGNAATYNGAATISLNAKGVKQVGGFLALAAQKDVNKPAEEWLVTINGRTGLQPNVVVKEKE